MAEVEGVLLGPDELTQDNLVCVFRSDPVDVATKRRHTDWLNDYINGYLIEKGFSESKRMVAASAIRGFYQTNDSALFGDYATTKTKLEPPAGPLFPEDIRRVLKAMPVRSRAPLRKRHKRRQDFVMLASAGLAPFARNRIPEPSG